ncbi:MAG TPA: hypothetical protein VGO58_07380 [Chitinophagaceae bacterium]|jgi:hypothetical protein|nr:hypothetical protein [Chitinophagaceae bacterium]
MRKPVKSLVLITISAVLFHSASAQLKLPVIQGIGNDIKKVIDDYPNRFANLMGEVIVENTQSTDYRCNFHVNGAEEVFLTRYSAKKEICSWQALMLTTESFEKAKQKFRSLFNQLNNLSVHTGEAGYRLKGKYEAPEEAKKFNSILFNFEPVNESGKKLKVEISMQYEAPMDWKVKVLVYDREREDEERGKRNEE